MPHRSLHVQWDDLARSKTCSSSRMLKNLRRLWRSCVPSLGVCPLLLCVAIAQRHQLVCIWLSGHARSMSITVCSWSRKRTLEQTGAVVTEAHDISADRCMHNGKAC